VFDAAFEGLQDIRQDLEQLSVRRVMLVPVTLSDGSSAAAAAVVLCQPPAGFVVWSFEARPTIEEVAGAVEELLRGLVSGRMEAIRMHPRVPELERPSPRQISDATASAMHEAVRGWLAEAAPRYPM
jgi:hypothetical protein